MKRMRPAAATTADSPTTPIAAPVLPEFASCDACPAPASVVVRLRGGGELALCRNHARRHDLALVEEGAVIFGEYSNDAELKPRPDPAHPVEAPEPDAARTRRWWQWLRPRRDPVPPRPSLHPDVER